MKHRLKKVSTRQYETVEDIKAFLEQGKANSPFLYSISTEYYYLPDEADKSRYYRLIVNTYSRKEKHDGKGLLRG